MAAKNDTGVYKTFGWPSSGDKNTRTPPNQDQQHSHLDQYYPVPTGKNGLTLAMRAVFAKIILHVANCITECCEGISKST